MDAQGFGHGFADGHERVQRFVGVLEDHLHLAAHVFQGAAGEGGDVLAVEDDLAGGAFFQPHEGEGQGGFAGAAFADDGQHFAAPQGQGDVVDGVDEAVGFTP